VGREDGGGIRRPAQASSSAAFLLRAEESVAPTCNLAVPAPCRGNAPPHAMCILLLLRLIARGGGIEAPPHRPLRGALALRLRLRLQEPLPELHQVPPGDGRRGPLARFLQYSLLLGDSD
jgi:hypothetical protein